ncbi:MAG: hypothetical protein VX737_02665 [Pseudomonadota bacterium]|nr:hypothetical protein [Pseudomonadota bacterium]
MKSSSLLAIIGLFSSIIADTSFDSAIFKNSNPKTPGYFTIYKIDDGYNAIGTYVTNENSDSQPKVWTALCSNLIEKSIQCHYTHTLNSESTGKFTITMKDDNAYLINVNVKADDKSHESQPKYLMIFPTDTTK